MRHVWIYEPEPAQLFLQRLFAVLIENYSVRCFRSHKALAQEASQVGTLSQPDFLIAKVKRAECWRQVNKLSKLSECYSLPLIIAKPLAFGELSPKYSFSSDLMTICEYSEQMVSEELECYLHNLIIRLSPLRDKGLGYNKKLSTFRLESPQISLSKTTPQFFQNKPFSVVSDKKKIDPNDSAEAIRTMLKLTYADLELNTLTCELVIQNPDFSGSGEKLSVELAFKEYRLLRHFIEKANQPITRESLRKHVWDDLRISPRNIDSYVSRLRKKLSQSHTEIKSLYGKGYVLTKSQG